MRNAITAACALALAASLGFAAAGAAEPPAQAASTSAPTTKSDAKMVGGTCLKSTGSRIAPKKGQCLIAPGNVYTQKQLHSTGKTTTAGALRDLSPNLTISH
jgi:hypothetical protein